MSPPLNSLPPDRSDEARDVDSDRPLDQNPFSTRFVRPGAIPFQFLGSDSLDKLVQRLRSQNWCGQIVGTHGSGKSTLLHSLIPELQRCGRNVNQFRLSPEQHSLPPEHQLGPWNAHYQIVIDGFEQLSAWSRWRLKRACRRYQAGLLVSSHRDVGLPELYSTHVSPEIANNIVQHLLVNFPTHLSHDDVQRSLARFPTNLREALFCLYDQYEEMRREK